MQIFSTVDGRLKLSVEIEEQDHASGYPVMVRHEMFLTIVEGESLLRELPVVISQARNRIDTNRSKRIAELKAELRSLEG